MASDLANLMNAELKEAFDAFDKVSVTGAAVVSCITVSRTGAAPSPPRSYWA